MAAGSPPPPYVAEEGVSNIDSNPFVPTVSQESSTAGLSNDTRNTSTSGRVEPASEASSSKPSKAKKPRLVMDYVLLPSNRSSMQVGSVSSVRRIVPHQLSFLEGTD